MPWSRQDASRRPSTGTRWKPGAGPQPGPGQGASSSQIIMERDQNPGRAAGGVIRNRFADHTARRGA